MLKYRPKNGISEVKVERQRQHSTGHYDQTFSSRKQFILFMLAFQSSCLVNGKLFNMQLRYSHLTGISAYIVFYIVFGVPIFMCQMLLGQYGKVGHLLVYRISPILYGVGYSMLIFSFFSTVFYAKDIGLGVLYLKESLVAFLDVKWSNCSNFKSRATCKDKHDNETEVMTCCMYAEEIEGNCLVNNKVDIVSFEFLHHMAGAEATSVKGPSVNLYPKLDWTVTVALTWFAAYMCVTARSEKLVNVVVKVLVLYLATTGLFILWATTFSGASSGIRHLIDFRFSSVDTVTVLAQAFTCVMETLQLGYGAVILFSSWRIEKLPVHSDAAIICSIELIVLFLNTLWTIMLFGVVQNRYKVSDKDCVRRNARGLVTGFTFMLEFALVSGIPQVTALIYYGCIFLPLEMLHHALLLLSVHRALMDAYPILNNNPKLLASGLCSVGFLLTLLTINGECFRIHILLRDFVFKVCGVVLPFLFGISALFLYGVSTLCHDFEFMLDFEIPKFWKYTWYITLPVMCVWAYYMVDERFGKTADKILRTSAYKLSNILLVVLILSPVIFYMLVQLFSFMKINDIKGMFRMDNNWGPTDRDKSKARKYFNPRKATRYRSPVLKCKHNCLQQSEELRKEIDRLNYRRNVFFQFLQSRESQM